MRRQSVSVLPVILQAELGPLITAPPPHQTAAISPSTQPTQHEAVQGQHDQAGAVASQ